MYLFRYDLEDYRKFKHKDKQYNIAEISRKLNMNLSTMSRIFHKKQTTTYRTAYMITKTINKNADIKDYFTFIKK